MMHLKAKCDLWIATGQMDGKTIIEVQADYKPLLKWLDDPEYQKLFWFEKGDTLTFKAIADGSDPYAQLATRYPEWFEIEELNK